MKKILSLFLGVVISFQVLNFGNFIHAQGNNNKEGYTGASDIGLNLTEGCVDGMGSKCLKYETLLGVGNESTRNKSVFDRVQDAIFGAIYFVGTLLVIILIRCGFKYVMSAGEMANEDSNLKKSLKNAAIGAVLVWGSYIIVRLVQYISKGD